ncbi:ERMES complex subunit [Rhodotorula kratochvilovae]
MSFNFEWPEFSEDFYADAREMLAQALNKGQKPPIIADRIEPPELEILEIGDLSTDRFRGIFRLTYSGDAYIVLQTKVQANPLNVPRPSLDILSSPRILFAAAPLVVPMTLRLSNLSLRAIVVLVVSRQKGITLVFKNDPLESVNVSSSFDGVESVAGFIQREIEAQLREAFRSDLPSVIHRLSQKWLSGEVKSAGKAAETLPPKARTGLARGFDKDAKIETRTAYEPGRDGAARGRGLSRRMGAEESDAGESVELASQADSTWSTWGGDRMGSSAASASASAAGGSYGRSPSLRRLGTLASPPSAAIRHDQLDSVPESIENYDPTYGLRPDAIPHHAGFADYERTVRAGASHRGLGDVLEVSEEPDEDELDPFTARRRPSADGSSLDFDLIGLRGLVDDGSQYPLARSSLDSLEYRPLGMHDQFETIPAVGGGTITRPRVFHTQSQMRMRTASTGSLSAHGSPSSVTARSAAGGSMASTVGLGRSTSFGQLAAMEARFGGAPSLSGASSAHFPFPKCPPPPAYPGSGSPSLVRNTSLPSLSRYPSKMLYRASSSTSTSPEVGRQTPFFRSGEPSAYSSPPSTLASPAIPPHAPPVEADDAPQLAYTRPSPVDLLSRSPSSVLNTSFLDEEHLPITLNPARNDSCAHLATLTSSNQTLSPFTRDHAHVTARSAPHAAAPAASPSSAARLAPSAPGAGGRVAILPGAGGKAPVPAQPVKAVRKRLHRIGSARASSPAPTPSLVSASASAAPSPLVSGTPALSRRGTTLSQASSLPTSPLRGSFSLAAPSLPAAAQRGLGAGRGAGGGAPSELSDYFPSTSGAREMLARMGLGGMGSPRR